jgi:hypothetical protein
MCNARIGQHSLDVGLRDRNNISERHRCQAITHMISQSVEGWQGEKDP